MTITHTCDKIISTKQRTTQQSVKALQTHIVVNSKSFCWQSHENVIHFKQVKQQRLENRVQSLAHLTPLHSGFTEPDLHSLFYHGSVKNSTKFLSV